MNRSTFRMIKYINGSIISKARYPASILRKSTSGRHRPDIDLRRMLTGYMNGVGFEILARTPVPHLPPSYPRSPPPPPSRLASLLTGIYSVCSGLPDLTLRMNMLYGYTGTTGTSTVILSLPLIQEGQLSVSGERLCTILINRLED